MMLAWNPTDEPIARMVALADLCPHDRNYKRHPVAQIARLQQSLVTFGQPRPISIWRGTILAGHGVYAAARESGWQQIWCAIAPDAWTEERAAAWMVADNETARGAEVDETALAELVEQSRAADIALEALGFDADALTALLTSIAPPVEPGAGGDEFDATPEDGPTRCQPGDLWIIRSPDGREHRLIVGDCTDPAVVERLMGGERADAVVTDPPYNINEGYFGYEDNKSSEEYAAWCKQWFLLLFQNTDCIALTPGTRNMVMWIKYIADPSWVHCWYKPNATNRTGASWVNVWEPLLRYGGTWRHYHDSLNYGIGMQHDTEGHPCPKSMVWAEWAIQGVTDKEQLIFDPFLGSGTTLIAAHRTGRRCYGIEIECKYADIVLRRCAAEGLTVERAS